MQRSGEILMPLETAAATGCVFRWTVNRSRVPCPTVDSSVNRSLLFLMFGSPIPAPKPSSRAAAGAVEKPSFIACAMSGIPGPSSSTSTSIRPGSMVTRISPREA